MTHSLFFGTLAALLAAAKRFFARLTEQPKKVLQRIGVAVGPLGRYLAEGT